MSEGIVAAQVVLPCTDLDGTLDFFTDVLRFRVEQISPADDPVAAVITGHGLRLRLDRDATGDPGAIRLLSDDPDAVAGGKRTLKAPNGTTVVLVDADPPLVVPPLAPALVVSRAGDESAWGVGRAGMHYRDLVPDRQGGRFIASHIRIPAGGPVPDYVHFHKVRFQMIYCARGWVKVVYEDQGEPFVLHAGDCVLQPPLIRHRVLESSPGMEVVEIGSPAIHDTFGDLEMTLPTQVIDPDRDFAGQRFVRHVAADARWRPWREESYECRDTGISAATGGLAGACVARPRTTDPGVGGDVALHHEGELLLLFVLDGSLSFAAQGKERARLGRGDSVVVPPGLACSLGECSSELELLEVTLPGGVAGR